MRAAVSRYSKLAPVECAAWRIAPATRDAALARMESIAMRIDLTEAGLADAGTCRTNPTRPACRRALSTLGNYGKRNVNEACPTPAA